MAVLLFTSVVLAGCSGRPAMQAYVSPDTIALAGVRVAKIRATPLYSKLERERRVPRFEQFRQEMGFDPAQGLEELLIASDGEEVLAIARGAVGAKPAGDWRSEPYHGVSVYTRSANEALALIGKDLALGGPVASVHAAIDQARNGGRGAPRDLLDRAASLPGHAQIWVVASGWKGASPEQLRRMGNLANLDRVLRLVDGASLTVDLTNGVHAVFMGDGRTDADGKSLADSLRALAALGRMAVSRGDAQTQASLQHAFDGLQVNQAGRTVRVNFDINEELAEKIVK